MSGKNVFDFGLAGALRGHRGCLANFEKLQTESAAFETGYASPKNIQNILHTWKMKRRKPFVRPSLVMSVLNLTVSQERLSQRLNAMTYKFSLRMSSNKFLLIANCIVGIFALL